MRLKLLIPIALALIVALLLVQLFGPSTGGVLSPQTTYITKPLAPDGLPNYALALLEQQSEGVTRDNNGAVLFWQAMGPGGSLTPQTYALVARRLGIVPSAASPYLVDASGKAMQKRIAEWITAERSKSSPGASPFSDDSGGAEELAIRYLDSLSTTPWTEADVPPLAQWVAENEQPLDMLVAAAARPRFFSPPPNVLADPNTPLISILLPAVQESRAAARSLLARATFRMGSGEYDQAWNDCLAAWRLGGQISQGQTLVEQLVGMANRSMARNATLALLQNKDLPEAVAARVLSDLGNLDAVLDVADSLNNSERLMFLDYTLRLVTRRLGGFGPGSDGMAGPEATVSKVFALDVNVPLRIGNEWYDRLAAISDISDRLERDAAMADFEAELVSLGEDMNLKFVGGLFSRNSRSQVFGEVMLTKFLPALNSALKARDRDGANLLLVKVAAALALHRARTGEYPETLDVLTPSILPELPADPYNGKPLIYARRGDGYLLYSVFENGADDGGDDYSGRILDGEWLRREDAGGQPNDSDLVIRLPMPPFRPLSNNGQRNDAAEQQDSQEQKPPVDANVEPPSPQP